MAWPKASLRLASFPPKLAMTAVMQVPMLSPRTRKMEAFRSRRPADARAITMPMVVLLL